MNNSEKLKSVFNSIDKIIGDGDKIKRVVLSKGSYDIVLDSLTEVVKRHAVREKKIIYKFEYELIRGNK